MIISHSNNFVFTRAPKIGGVSLAMYLLQAGLVNGENDEYELEGGFNTWQEFKAFSDSTNNLDYETIPRNLYHADSLEKVNVTFQSLVDSGKVAQDMPCIGVIRHPFDWLSSLFYYANKRREMIEKQNIEKYGKPTKRDELAKEAWATPDSAHHFIISRGEEPLIQNILKPQTDYYPDHAQLFNFENLHEHACQFIAEKGGIAPEEKIEIRKSDHDSSWYIENLSKKYKDRALKVYEKDMVAWEKAYAKFN
jgi:hypothetical protein